jgi:calcium-translocating P-type ATPase
MVSECKNGARGIVLAVKKGSHIDKNGTIPDGLVPICGVLLRDRARKSAPAAVRRLRGAGIRVVMVTGDSRETAEAIARDCGILSGECDTVIDSTELALMSDGEVREILPRLGAVARALPSDKSRLVRIAQSAGRVTGMTGDGINDAPALRIADVGFAMGSGNAVAKDAGDIVILSNDLDGIANAVLYGRNIFKSIKKFICLQLTVNLSAVGISMAGPFIGIDRPVTVVQMLWLNIIMDTLGGLAFAGEAAEERIMKEKPKRRDEEILSPYMKSRISFLGLFSLGLSMFFLCSKRVAAHFAESAGDVRFLTGFFAFFVFLGLFNCFNSRSDRLNIFSGLGKNAAFVLIICSVAAVQLMFTYVGGSILRTVPLTAEELWFSLSMALAALPAGIAHTVWRRLRGKKDGF